MAAGDVTTGRRRDDSTPPWELEPGEYCVRTDSDSGQRVAWVVTPNGHGPARLEGWTLTEHDDGTITMSPSILAHPSTHLDANDQVVELAEWHGYLERGVWREV
jgi:hypothetical protein